MAGLLDMWGESPGSQADLALALGLLGGRGSLGSIISQAGLNAQGIYSQARAADNKFKTDEMHRKLYGAQIEETLAQAEQRRRGMDLIGKINVPQVTPASLSAFLKSRDPKDLEIAPTSETRTFDAYRALTPDLQAAQYDFKHDPYKVSNVAGVPSIVRAGPGMFSGGRLPGATQAPTIVPLSDLKSEVSAAASKAGSEAAARERGQIAGNVAGETDIRRPQQAKTALSTLEDADKLLDVATGSLIGKGRDIALGAVGVSMTPDKAAARLKVIQGTLLGQMPKFKGQDSDKDVRNYIEAVGQIGDDTIPTERRRDALDTVRKLFRKSAAQETSPNRPPREGEVVKGYRFKGGDPSDESSWERVR